MFCEMVGGQGYSFGQENYWMGRTGRVLHLLHLPFSVLAQQTGKQIYHMPGRLSSNGHVPSGVYGSARAAHGMQSTAEPG